jgi:RHS repeat-associated protein
LLLPFLFAAFLHAQENGLVRLTNDGKTDQYPAWSPTGAPIMYSSSPSGGSNPDICAVSPDGSNPHQITSDTHDVWGGGITDPIWLGSTGDLVVLNSDYFYEWMRLGLSANPSFPIVRSVWDGDSPYFSQILFMPGGLGGMSFAVSPNGNEIAWSAKTTQNGICPAHTDLHVSPLSSLSDQTTITGDLTGCSRSGNTCVNLDQKTTVGAGTIILSEDLNCALVSGSESIAGISFSPDASEIVVAVATNPNIYGFDLYIYKLNGTLVRRLTQSGSGPNPVINWNPVWSSNNRIAFASNSTGRFEIWTINADGSSLTQITTNGGDMPTWSPDSSKVAFISSRAGTPQLYSVSVGGATVIPQPQPPLVGGGSPSNNRTSEYSQEPVNTGNGNYYYEHSDFSIPARGIPLVFQRFYNSIDNFTGPLGTNWNHGYDVLLGQTAAGVATIRWGDGHGESYTLKNGIYVPQAGVYNILVANPDGTFTLIKKDRTQYNFSSTGKLTSVQDKNGNAVTLSYGSNGNFTQITDAVGRSLTLSYDSGGRITQVTDPISRTVTYAYDANNNLVSVTDAAGGATQYAYDGNHRVVQITLPNTTILLKNAYDGQGRVTSQTNGRGFTWQFAYNTPGTGQTTITDARNNKTVHSYDSSLRIMSIADPLGNTTGYTYDAENDRMSVTNPNGKTTNFAYDGNGNLTQITDPLTNAVRMTYDGANNLLTLTNPKDRITSFAYDAHGNLTTATDADSHVSTTAYDSYGEATSRTDANGHTTTFAYDPNGDLVTVTNALGQVTKLGYDAVSHLVSVTDANGHTTNNSYSALDRITKSTDPLGEATQFTYDAAGNLLKTTDPNNNATGYVYDAASNLASVTDAKGNVAQYAYDPDNNRIGFTNANGKTTTYAFDAANRLISATDPLSFVTSHIYDSAGNVIGVKDANGKTNQFAYDALNRVSGVTYSDGTSVGYAFDPDGKRVSMTDPHGTTAYAYDDLDRLTSVTNPGGIVVRYSYDARGHRTGLTYPDGKTLGYQYDPANRLSTVTDWLSRQTTYGYDTGGNLTAITYPTNAGVTFVYDGANRLTSVANKAITGLYSSTAYTLDPAGNRTAITANGLIRRYGYDALNQLISQTVGTQVTSWTYDPSGNRLSQVVPTGTTNYSYDDADRLLSAGATTFAYDADGNRISQTNGSTAWAYSYDAANRLSSVVGTGVNNTSSYDGDGNRIGLNTALGNYSYVNDTASGLPVVLNEQGPDGNITFAYGANLIEEASSTFNYFYGYDGLGSVVGLTDGATGKAVSAYAYDAWGNATSNGSVGMKDKFRFTGQALDPGTGLYYLRARYYDPSVGRFAAKDPFGGFAARPLSQNKFIYTINRPTSASDPTGLCSCETSGPSILNQLVSTTSPMNTTSTVPPTASELALNQPSANTLPSPSDVVGAVVDELPALVPAVGELVTYLGASYGSSALIGAGIALTGPEAVILATGATVLYDLGPTAFAPIPVAH